MKWMMTLTTLSLVGIAITGNSIYSEVQLFNKTTASAEVTANMYRSLIWHMDVYNDHEFIHVAESYFADGKIDAREYSKLLHLAKETSGPLIYLTQSEEQLWHARITFKKYLENREEFQLVASQ
ncbi:MULTISPECIES: hypothetical protein [Pseudoalteromonas]|uniref:Orphan protein n=1 Tax=Pseudoalteromonas haloplanktis TaxID=228 RepID=A0ABU1B846_PSEHA|nr:MULTISPECIES: hypothetical protein [Pseudoalteromonas]MCF6142926.1 hypothetical protein [Pseudoalteromonas mariniglutinosa NCIMB 1770]MDQ9090698.1 hypothetical protein [Pseudoalteromonas haloplanktis]TMN70702.1 hypothetical protein CWB85_14380 [Pseudoalteromonas sp. S1727]